MSPSNPRVSKPLTREQQDVSIKEALDLFNVALEGAPFLGSEKAEQDASQSADHLRRIFPDLDDRTLARFAAYIFINFTANWSEGDDTCADVLLLAMHFGQMTRQLSALPFAPEAPEPSE